jgi:tetratricopeptide (TPR) repeat protein
MAKAPSMTEKIVETYAQALQGHAVFLMDTNQREAKALLVKSIVLNPESAQGHFQLGRLYTAEGNTLSAVASYQKAIELDPNMPRALFNLAFLYATNKDFAGAERMFERVIVLAPSFVDEAYFNLAYARIRMGKVQEAIGNLEAAYRINPKNEQAKRLLDQLKKKSGRKG